jgi:4-alpha-glucanotransferase
MKVLQFAFDSSEDSDYLPFHYQNCSVVYTGTHDNETTLGWIAGLNDHDRDLARRYVHSENTSYETFVWDFIREAHRSVADTCIIPIQDYLVKGNEARINHPATTGTNWQWRMKEKALSEALSDSIFRMTKLYGRLNRTEPKAEEVPETEEASKTGEVPGTVMSMVDIM